MREIPERRTKKRMKKLVIEFETRQERLQEVLDYYKRIKKEYPYAVVHIRVKA